MWTLNWWSPILTSTLLVYITSYIFAVPTVWHFIIHSVILVLSTFNTLSYWLLNSLDTYTIDNSAHFNMLLINPINHYHPNLFLFTISFFYLLLFYILLSYYQKFIRGFAANLSTKFDYIFKKILILNILTTLLGSWWALQEGSWGGWWNWDISEVFSLVILFNVAYLLHRVFSHSITILDYTTWLVLILKLLIFNLVVQYNLTTSTHAFGQEFTRGSIISRPQTLIVFSIPMWSLLILHTLKSTRLFRSFMGIIVWGILGEALSTKSYRVWFYLFNLVLFNLFFLTMVKPVVNLPEFLPIGTSSYTLSWYSQLLLLTLLILIYYCYWEVYYLLLSVVFIYYPIVLLPLLTPLFLIRSSKFVFINLHLLLLGAVILNILYLDTTTVLPPQYLKLKNYLNFSLEVDSSLGYNVFFDGNWVVLTNTRYCGVDTTSVSSLLVDVTSFFNNTYILYFPTEFTETRLLIGGMYIFWAGYEVEFIAPILGFLGLLVVILLYLATKQSIRRVY